MRLTVKKALLATFDLMIVLVTNKFDHEIKTQKNIISHLQSHEQFVSHKCNHEINSFFFNVQVANNWG
jgi:hypothetical protein